VDLFRLTKKIAISANLFTLEHKFMLNCVLRGKLVNQILEDQKAVKFCSLRLPIFQTIRAFGFCFVWQKKLLY
jgi:hypothetical protein